MLYLEFGFLGVVRVIIGYRFIFYPHDITLELSIVSIITKGGVHRDQSMAFLHHPYLISITALTKI